MAVTHKSLQLQRERYQSQIQYYEQQIASLREQITHARAEIKAIDKREQQLTAFEAQPIENRTLYASIDNTTRTVDLFDHFESINKQGFHKYSRLIFLRGESYRGQWYYYIIERLQTKDYEGDITATEFKRDETYQLQRFAKKELDQATKQAALHDGQIIMFEKPFHFRAQNSANRTGYGNIYEGEDLIYEGTLYGETTDYAVVGVLVANYTFGWQRRKDWHYY